MYSIGVLFFHVCLLTGAQPGSVEQLVTLSNRGQPLLDVTLAAGEVGRVQKRVEAHQDRSSLHLLIALRRDHKAVYNKIQAETKARILIDALKHTKCADDWSHLIDSGAMLVIRPPKSKAPKPTSSDGTAAQALLELPAKVTAPMLIDVLQDEDEICWSGSAEATRSYLEQLRRCDLAFRYLCILNGIQPTYKSSVQARDQAIEALMKQLKVKPLRPFEGRKYERRRLDDK
jgi:hypothetical protein